MNSLVVLLSVVALAFAKPSQLFDGDLLAYSAPVVAYAPSAVSTQSRFDIKTSPAVVSTAAYAPLATRTVIAEPALLAAPAAFAAPAAVSHQSRLDIKTSPGVVSTAALAPFATRTVIAEPTLLSAPTAIAGATAVSQQSRIDIKSTPAITSTVVSSAPFGYSSYSAPIATAAIAPTVVKTAAIAQAIAEPAYIKTAAFVPGVIGNPAVPLCDTPEVAAARAAHFEANAALTGAHVLHKRSAPLFATAPLLSAHTYSTVPVISTHGAYLSSPIVTKTYGLW